MLFEDKFFLKLYRKLEDGVNPDVEVTRFLTERTNFANVPSFHGTIEYRRGKSEPTIVCVLQNAVSSECDAWTLTLDSVGRYYERVLGRKADLQNETAPPGALLDELIGGIYPEKAKLLGQRTGELHRALASSDGDPAFAPEPFNTMAQRSAYQNMRALLRRNFALLQKKLKDVPESTSRGSSGSSRRGQGNSRVRKTPPRPKDQRRQDSHSRRLSPRATSLHRKGFCHSRFRRRTGARAGRTQTKTLSLTRCRRHDAFVSIRGLQRALAACHAQRRRSVPRALG